MQLPDESISYQYQSMVIPTVDEWSASAELRTKHFLSSARLKSVMPQMMQVRGQVATERELQQVPPELKPLDAGFIDLPQKTLDAHRRKGEASDLGRTMALATRMRAQVDHVVILGIGGSFLGPMALYQALSNGYHNELKPAARMGTPRIYFAGCDSDNDSLQELLEHLQNVCVDPELREERWGLVVISKSGTTLETAAAFRTFRKEMFEFYGSHSKLLRELVIPITGSTSRLRDLCKAEAFPEEDILSIPDDVGGRFSVFSPVGLLPAAILGLDVKALLLGAAAMTRRFLDEPFERNPVLQFACINHLAAEELGKAVRVMAVWSKKLEALGQWYDHLVAESLGKHGRGVTPLTCVMPRDLHTRGQQHQEGARDKIIHNLLVKQPKSPPIQIGMSDRNEDDLNGLSRKSLPDILDASWRGATQASFDAARPTADLLLPTLSEHTIGQLMQMLMLSTVVEARLMGINPYGQPGVEVYRKHMRSFLKS